MDKEPVIDFSSSFVRRAHERTGGVKAAEESGDAELEDQQNEPVGVLKWCMSCMEEETGKSFHRLRKDFRGHALCFTLPAADSSKGGGRLQVSAVLSRLCCPTGTC